MKIKGTSNGLCFYFWSDFDKHGVAQSSEDFYLYPSEKTPKQLIRELEHLIEKIKDFDNNESEIMVEKAD